MIEFFDQFRQFEILTVGHIPDIECETNTGRLYNSLTAAENGKASLLYFFSLMDIYGEVNMGFFFDVLGNYASSRDIYIFAVTDNSKSEIEEWMKGNDFSFVWLNDEKSLLHYNMQVLIHPMLLLLDRDGRLVMMTSWRYPRDVEIDEDYRTAAQELAMKRIAEVLASEPTASAE
jgi:hypothetical protein